MLCYLGTTPPSGMERAGRTLCLAEMCTLLHWPYLTSPLKCFQHTVLQDLNLCSEEWFSVQAYAESPDRTSPNITVFTTRENFGPMIQVQQWNKHSVAAESYLSG